MLAAVESSQLARGIVLLNSAGRFGNPSEQHKNNEGESETALQKLVVYPLKEVIQRIVLGFLFWQAKQPVEF
ncbi:pheophytinase, chloroplastic-like [Canna indica]|uniref:Pheophytinase, chloroplastic-like n=1 Tax=Canna indica TaxID=4628 RepID=A0AAQ3K4T6_9LILI|nr:pheophytinase, chloroplastic-like [Canna indica]